MLGDFFSLFLMCRNGQKRTAAFVMVKKKWSKENYCFCDGQKNGQKRTTAFVMVKKWSKEDCCFCDGQKRNGQKRTTAFVMVKKKWSKEEYCDGQKRVLFQLSYIHECLLLHTYV